MIDFKSEQVFLVTGASSGIGAGVVRLLNSRGATVVGVARRLEQMESLKSELKFPERFFCEQRDLSKDIEALPAYVKELKAKYGKFSGLASCAGVGCLLPLQVLDFDRHRAVFDVNYFSHIYLAKGLADRRNNVGRGTSMVFVSSISAVSPDKSMLVYAGSKAALIASVKSIAKELAPYGIRANLLSPAEIMTPMIEHSEIAAARRHMYPMGFGDVSDVANLLVFLLSGEAKWITGQNYVVDCASMG